MVTATKRRVMTAQEATSFDRMSAANAAIVEKALDGKCACAAYIDVFTYGRWLGLGQQVQRNQKSIAKLPGWKTVEERDEKTGELIGKRGFHKPSYVFCRCQVKPSNGNGNEQAPAIPAKPPTSRRNPTPPPKVSPVDAAMAGWGAV